MRQGSVLGPLLFLIYINELTDNLKSDSFLFADDSLLLHTYKIGAEKTAIETINNDLNVVQKWAIKLKMKFNYTKTNLINFTKVRNYDNTNFSVSFDSNIMKPSNVVKHLGIHLSYDLNWTTHINHVISKSSKLIGLLKGNSTFLNIKQ